MRRTVPLILMLLLLPAAGCLGGDGGSDVGPAAADGGANNTSTANVTANATSPNATTGYVWNTTTIEGSVDGVNTVVLSEGSTWEHLNVTDGSRNLTLNFSSDGEVWVTIYPPGCEQSGQFSGDEECSHQASTGNSVQGDGQATWSTEDPKPGHWRLEIYRGNAGAGSTSYTIGVAILQPAPASTT